MSSRKATESFYFVHTTQYIYEGDNKSALERLGRQATFKFRALWRVRDSKRLNAIKVIRHTGSDTTNCAIDNKESLFTHVPATYFDLYKVIIREIYTGDITTQQIQPNMCVG